MNARDVVAEYLKEHGFEFVVYGRTSAIVWLPEDNGARLLVVQEDDTIIVCPNHKKHNLCDPDSLANIEKSLRDTLTKMAFEIDRHATKLRINFDVIRGISDGSI